MQVCAWHSVSTPHCEPELHWTQVPAPLQTPLEQALLTGRGGFDDTPPVHTFAVHSLPSFGTSVGSTTLTTLPVPSHTREWQSPTTWPVAIWVPKGA